MKPLNVIIIGAGLGGLACGIRLAAEGCRVKILEKNVFAGGSLGTSTINGFRFNIGAEYITAPLPIFVALIPDCIRFADIFGI